MIILGGFFVTLIGLLMACFPSVFFDLTESWKHASFVEPSDRYLLSLRIIGGLFTVLGVAAIVVSILM